MIKIRKAGPEDVRDLYDLYTQIGHKENGYFERCLDEGYGIFIAEHDGETGGFCILNTDPRYSLYKKLNVPELQDLNVIPSLRQKGIATSLVRHCEKVAKESGAEALGIAVGLTKDYGSAQRLYIKLGYMPDGYGMTYDRETVPSGARVVADDDLCLMLLKPM